MGYNKSKTIKFLSLILCLCYFTVHSQTIPTRVDIPSPQVAAINRFMETSVGHFTGVPQISIPLYEIKIKDVTVPITLNYHAGGIRVDQEASWVGLGWNLSYGGQITRNVRGTPDEKHFIPAALIANNQFISIEGYKALPDYQQDSHLVERSAEIFKAKISSTDKSDFMPDEFYYSVLGQSGKFMYNQSLKKFVVYPKSDIKTSLSNDYKLFNVVLSNGVSIDLGQDGRNIQYDPNNANVPITTSCWSVKTIYNTNNENINYTYVSSSYTMPKLSGQDYCFPLGVFAEMGLKGGHTYVSESNKFDDALVETISFPEGTIKFITADRFDMPTKALKEVWVLNKQQEIIKKIILHQSYFIGQDYDVNNMGLSINIIQNYSDDYRFKRMRLDSISIVGKSNTKPIKYKFDYNTLLKMPSKYSFAQDHWGYFNGIANQSMIPALLVSDGIDPIDYKGGDRRVKPDKSNVFTLKSIVWPEGGKTEFTYENNDCSLKHMPVVPTDLLNQHADDNFTVKTADITVSGYPRSSFSITPDYIDPVTNTRYFKKRFTVSRNSLFDLTNGWECITDFGVKSAIDNSYEIPFGQCNVEFVLEQINDDGSHKWIKSFNNTAQNTPYTRLKENKEYLPIFPGEYEMILKITYFGIPVGHEYDAQSHFTYFKISWRELNEGQTLFTGGLRIKNITYYDKTGAKAKIKTYSYTNPLDNITSGKASAFPMYIQNKYKNYEDGATIPKYFKYYFSNSVLPLLTIGGSYVGYEYVSEYDQNITNPNDSFRTSYKFQYMFSYFPSFYTQLFRTMKEPDEWIQGRLLNKTIYKGLNVLQQEDFDYYDRSPYAQYENDEEWVDEINTDMISFVALSPDIGAREETFLPDFYLDGDYKRGLYPTYEYGVGSDFYGDFLPYVKHYTGFDKPKTKTTTLFNANGEKIVTTENYYYEKTPTHYQITKTESINSKKETVIQKFKYPQDYAGTLVYDKLIQQYRISPIIELSQFNGTKELTRIKNNYGLWNGSTLIAPLSIEKFVSGGSTAIQIHNFDGYDTKGNLLRTTPQSGPSVSYKWGYDQQYPVAECKNAAENEFYFESFEDDAAASTANFHTGLKCNTGRSFTVSFTKPNLRTYTITWFELEGSLWKYKEETYTGTKTFSATSYIDDIRVFPSDAQITTYTYEPLVGMTSSTDAKGQTSYYEYDDFQRLKWIKDQDGNILKTIDYHYQNQ